VYHYRTEDIVYVTTRFVGIQRGGVKYLVFLLTQDYIEENRKIAEAIGPSLERFARDLGDSGAVVRPFQGNADATLGDALNGKMWDEQDTEYMRNNLPALLITSVDFDDFDPRSSQYALVFLRDLIDKHGNVEIFSLENLLTRLLNGAKQGRIFEAADDFLRNRDAEQAREAVALKPGIWGVTLDLAKAKKIYTNIQHRSIKH
jgi:hypothetical protein